MAVQPLAPRALGLTVWKVSCILVAEAKKSHFFHVLLVALTAPLCSTYAPKAILKFNFGCAGHLIEGFLQGAWTLHRGVCSCGMRAHLLHGMCDLPRLRMEHVSLAWQEVLNHWTWESPTVSPEGSFQM